MLTVLQETGTFTGTLTGGTTAPTITITWVKLGASVLLHIPAVTVISNSTACTITGVPAALQPIKTQFFPILDVKDGGVDYIGAISPTGGSGTLTLYIKPGAALSTTSIFTNSGIKGLPNAVGIKYMLT